MAGKTQAVAGMTVEERFDALAERWTAAGATRAKMFGSACLKSRGKVFATLFQGRLVLKLPRERVAALTAAGKGEPFDPGMGRLMREWVVLAESADAAWDDLTAEAHAFVSGG